MSYAFKWPPCLSWCHDVMNHTWHRAHASLTGSKNNYMQAGPTGKTGYLAQDRGTNQLLVLNGRFLHQRFMLFSSGVTDEEDNEPCREHQRQEIIRNMSNFLSELFRAAQMTACKCVSGCHCSIIYACRPLLTSLGADTDALLDHSSFNPVVLALLSSGSIFELLFSCCPMSW